MSKDVSTNIAIRHCERKWSNPENRSILASLDCCVASLLAMTGKWRCSDNESDEEGGREVRFAE